MSVNSYLNSLQSDLYVNGTEREKIRKSIDAISTRLDWYFGNDKNCEHKIIKKDIFGSYSRDTMLSRKFDEKSDIDYMIVFEDADKYTPQTCLNWLKGFAEYWYSTSIVKQSLPTIVIELENIKFELVPAYENYGMKFIAWDSSKWQYTDPDKLKNEMLDLNIKTDSKFKRMIRLMKYWNINKNGRGFTSYELEKFLTEKFSSSYTNCDSTIDYLDWAFWYLKNYKSGDYYTSVRINNAYNTISEAKNFDLSGNSIKAEEKIRKIFE